jgi:NADH dehydrogenase
VLVLADEQTALTARERFQLAAARSERVLVLGGGASGVEMAAAVATTWPSIAVTIADRRSVGAFAGPRVEAAIRASLETLNVTMEDDAEVTRMGGNHADTRDGRRLAFDAIVACAGWHAPPWLADAGLGTDQSGRVLVDGTLRSLSHPKIYAGGDVAHPVDDTGSPFRSSVWVAIVSGAHAADNIAREIGNRAPKRLNFATWGQGVALGNGGVGFPTFPDDHQRLLLFRGRSAHALRNFFVALLLSIIRVARGMPGAIYWVRGKWRLEPPSRRA